MISSITFPLLIGRSGVGLIDYHVPKNLLNLMGVFKNFWQKTFVRNNVYNNKNDDNDRQFLTTSSYFGKVKWTKKEVREIEGSQWSITLKLQLKTVQLSCHNDRGSQGSYLSMSPKCQKCLWFVFHVSLHIYEIFFVKKF